MILTLTANPAIDRVILIPGFTPQARILAQAGGDYVGGGGFDVSVALSGLGADTLAMGIPAGENGRRLEFLLHGYGIPHNLTWVEGETRIVHVLVESDYHRHTLIITPGCQVSPQDLQVFLSRYRSRAWEADWVVAAGSLAEGIPDDFYAQVVEIAHQAGVLTLVDCFGEPLRLALAARPDLVKLTLAELCATFDLLPATLAEPEATLRATAAIAASHHLPALAVARSSNELVAWTPAGLFRAVSPSLPSVNAAGAGDCISAGLVWRLSLGDSWPEALRWAVAAGSAGTLTPGTGELRLQDVLKFLPGVLVEKMSPASST